MAESLSSLERPLFTDQKTFVVSTHAENGCVSCHSDIDELPHADTTQRVNCGNCHDEQQAVYNTSVHGIARLKGHTDVPSCGECHDYHTTRAASDPKSNVYPMNLPGTCGKCHSDPKLAAEHHIPIEDAYLDYSRSVHGKGLMQGGLLVSASCISCHGSHAVYANSDPRSPMHPKNVVATCSSCHVGILPWYKESVHGQLHTKGKESPTCISCHPDHEIADPENQEAQLATLDECGGCHDKELQTYRASYHGKVTALGYSGIAKCADCHGMHRIFSSADPRSTVHEDNLLETCQNCHPDAPQAMVSFKSHGDYHDRDNWAAGYYTWLAMTCLLIGVFGFFGLHTLFWLLRCASDKGSRPNHVSPDKQRVLYRRFDKLHIFLHILVIISFLGLALTGLPLKFSYTGWATGLAHFMGGFQTAAFLHRVCSLITFGYLLTHLIYILRAWLRLGLEIGFLRALFGPDSPIPRWQDAKDFLAMCKWFAHRGPKPVFDRWTYWEKFDYLAVFWGVPVIGLSGLVLWFPELTSQFLPGWAINIAMIIHGDEALLATGFIFAIHFFNTHLRPERFPLDSVIFTGGLSEAELKSERRPFYERMKASGELSGLEQHPPSLDYMKLIRVFSLVAVTIGSILLVLMIVTAFWH
jgi:thiosulfate reductase cytochrome b subunit